MIAVYHFVQRGPACLSSVLGSPCAVSSHTEVWGALCDLEVQILLQLGLLYSSSPPQAKLCPDMGQFIHLPMQNMPLTLNEVDEHLKVPYLRLKLFH